ncbi:hypothetical protein PMZ80_001198 [Knufia obscura]|uniref:Uncharacterized protein n=1 Tax=Knufia obscura TaxID=1635080 RepID=A0ABR0S2E4_9EURO|nr:hypothetical protein PMZ80_001198 [Knufia obscura]
MESVETPDISIEEMAAARVLEQAGVEPIDLISDLADIKDIDDMLDSHNTRVQRLLAKGHEIMDVLEASEADEEALKLKRSNLNILSKVRNIFIDSFTKISMVARKEHSTNGPTIGAKKAIKQIQEGLEQQFEIAAKHNNLLLHDNRLDMRNLYSGYHAKLANSMQAYEKAKKDDAAAKQKRKRQVEIDLTMLRSLI